MQLGRRLALWSVLSLVASALMLLLAARPEHKGHKRNLWRGAASQFAGWGAIDLGIALLGMASAKKQAASPDAHAPEQQLRGHANLRKILWINTGLDVGYVSGGLALARTIGKSNPFWRGTGWGIVLQGCFLFIFDLLHVLGLQP